MSTTTYRQVQNVALLRTNARLDQNLRKRQTFTFHDLNTMITPPLSRLMTISHSRENIMGYRPPGEHKPYGLLTQYAHFMCGVWQTRGAEKNASTLLYLCLLGKILQMSTPVYAENDIMNITI